MNNHVLFEEKERVNSEKKGWEESEFEYLDRSNLEGAAEIRKSFNVMFAVFPDKKDIRNRLRSKDVNTYTEACSELYVNWFLASRGWQINGHPKGLSSKNKNPDFWVEHPIMGGVIVEVTTAYVDKMETRKARGRLERFIDVLRRRVFESVWLDIELRGVPNSDLPAKKIIKGLRRELSYQGSSVHYEVTACGMEICFKGRASSSKSGGVGSVFFGTESVDPHRGIRQAVEKKSYHYGRLSAPLILVVNVVGPYYQDAFAVESLFGDKVYVGRERGNGEIIGGWINDGKGVIYSPGKEVNTNVSAVCIVSDLGSYDGKCKVRLYHHPSPICKLNDTGIEGIEEIRLGESGRLAEVKNKLKGERDGAG